MPAVDRVLRETGTELAALCAIGVDVGPGSFTGVRIGVATANAFAFALSIPVVAVESLLALRRGAGEDGPVCALLDARNGNVYAALFLPGQPHTPEAAPLEDVLVKVPEHTLFLGDGAALHRERILRTVPGARFRLDSDLLRAGNVGLCAWDKFLAGEGRPEALPLYLRPSQAERVNGR